MDADLIQVGGTHYKDQPIQTWDYIHRNNIGYLEGNIIKYVSRWKNKNGLEDLKKARHYLDKLIQENANEHLEFSQQEYKNDNGYQKTINYERQYHEI